MEKNMRDNENNSCNNCIITKRLLSLQCQITKVINMSNEQIKKDLLIQRAFLKKRVRPAKVYCRSYRN